MAARVGGPCVRANRHGVVQLGTSLWLGGIDHLYILLLLLSLLMWAGVCFLMYSVSFIQFLFLVLIYSYSYNFTNAFVFLIFLFSASHSHWRSKLVRCCRPPTSRSTHSSAPLSFLLRYFLNHIFLFLIQPYFSNCVFNTYTRIHTHSAGMHAHMNDLIKLLAFQIAHSQHIRKFSVI